MSSNKALALSVAIFLSLSLPTSSLRCYSTICHDPDEHGFCVQTCTRPDDACYGSFHITSNHTVTPLTFGCLRFPEHSCQATSCQFSGSSPYDDSCCCRGQDLCNSIPGLFGDNTPAPPIVNPIPPVTPPAVAGDQLVCEFNNCTSTSSNNNCFHGYQVCTDHPSADTISNDPSNHFCAVHARRTSSGLYELESKGCVITTDPSIHQLGSGRSMCTLDTQSSENDIACYCDGMFCNNGTNLEFTDPSRYVGPSGDILCDRECSHSCVVSGGVPRCLCPSGYALDTDLMTCVDINECLDDHNNDCSHICSNTQGSYTCSCPPNQGLRLTTNGTRCEQIPSLFCARHDQDCDSVNGNCDSIAFCDRSLNVTHDPSDRTCIALASLIDGEFLIRLQACFVHDPNHPCTEDDCVLGIPPDSQNRNTYSCCCRSNLCNARLVYPEIYNDTAVPLTPVDMGMTTDGSTGGEGMTASTNMTGSSTRGMSQWTLPVFAAVASIVMILLIVVSIALFIACRNNKVKACYRKSEDESDDYMYPQPIDLPLASAQLLPRANQFENPPIGSGRFSTVYKQMVARDIRAVKVFQRKDKTSYDRELDIYQQPNIKHSNILLFIGNNEFPDELQLIFEYHPVGSLYDLLNKQTISMKQFCEIASSASRGLAHLHTEVIKDGVLIKPCVAHRDLKSKNILIKSDMHTACISDFGLAIKWPLETGTEAHGQVGTARYMAPEVLEGAISFDPEAYFRIDIYAFALILWELTTRTKTVNGPVAEYRPPFDDLVPPNPSLDDMKRVVVDRQRRPEIPKTFSNHSEMDDIVNTIQETWDCDVDARLSSQCVCERLAAFASKFESSKERDSGFSAEYDTAEPPSYSTPSHGSSMMSGSPTNTMKPAISEASTTLTEGAIPMGGGYPNAAVHEVMTSSMTNNNKQRQAAAGGVSGGTRPPTTGGGNPMVNYPQLPAVNVAPPLHSPGEYQYRFVQAPAFPRPNNEQHHRGNQSQSSAVTVRIGRPQPPHPSSGVPLQRSHVAAATEQFTNLNNRNSREIAQQRAPPSATPTSLQYHMESTV